MDHNQTVVDQYLQKCLAIESRIIAVDLYAAVKDQLNPKLELIEFRQAISAWFKGPMSQYESKKGRFGGIMLANEESRIAKESAPETANNETEAGETEESEGLVVYMSPSVRLYQPDSRNWAIQKKNGDVWVSQYYQNTLDAIIVSFIRHSMNGEFKVSSNKISELKELVKLIQSTKESLEEKFRAVIVEKAA